MDKEQIEKLKESEAGLEMILKALDGVSLKAKKLRESEPGLYLSVCFHIRIARHIVNSIISEGIDLPIIKQKLYNASPLEAKEIVNSIKVTITSILAGY